MANFLHLDELTASVGERLLFGPLTFDIAPGEIMTVMGPSGVGKSTLLAIIAGMADKAVRWTGSVSLAGQGLANMLPEKRRIGLLFQDSLLFPHLSVAKNLGFGLSAKIRGAERKQKIEAALAQANMADFANRDPATLSGGEGARIALMRTLLAEPEAILLDEPFSKLDLKMRQQIRRFTFERIREQNLPCLMVTHDREDAQAAGGKEIILSCS